VTQANCGFYLAVERMGSVEAGQTLELQPGARQISIASQAQAMWARYAND